MRILMLNHNVAWSGGTFFRAYHVARQMAGRGHHVTLLTIARSNRFTFQEQMNDGVRVVETPDLFWGRGRSGWDPWDAVSRILFVRRHPWDLVHAFDSRPVVIVPGILLQNRGVPLIMDWADWWGRGGANAVRPGWLVNVTVAPIETFLEERSRQSADGNTVISTALYERAVALGCRRELLLHLMQGSDVEGVRPVEQSKARDILGIPRGMLLLGHLGVLNPSDAELLFSAFRLVLQMVVDCKLVLIGRHRCTLGKYRRLCEKVFETGSLSHEELVCYLAACDILLLPLADNLANRARWPGRVNDYLAMGRPVVATAVGDVAVLIREDRVGLVAQPQAEDFATAIVTLLRDQALRVEFGRRARSVAEEKLAWSLVTRHLEGFYLKVLGAKVG